ncbi:MAG: class III lanthionine synthetase LanKC, partial [Nocardiopsaceae bacterium]|nr:class III lanthionine synthetase LanKC [Nocardiopsaceae bacterium]
MTHPLFYDSPRHDDRHSCFPVVRRPLPRGWRRRPHGDWMNFIAPNYPLPHQGWKIHVSACEENAHETLTRVWEYCVPREISFKIIGSSAGIRMRNAKYAARDASGKAATIYPADEAACERVLRELDARLGGAAGPYILSDLRYGAGPLYVRYGGFTLRQCTDSNGEPVPAIENPAGELVPDVRSPVFSVPDWITIPDFLAPHLAARNSIAIANLDYDVTSALHFSNGGGVYVGTDKRDGRKVILKEARPHAGLAGDGSDAVARLHREYDLMRRLSGLGIAPEALAYFQVDDHHFLVEEFIDGGSFYNAIADRYPLAKPDPDPESLADFTSWALRACAETERAAELMHSRGVVFNDLHPHNIMARPDGTMAFIDFEAAADAGDERRLTVANPGFMAPRNRTGFGVDAYSLACVRLAVFLPQMTMLLPLDWTKAAQLAAEIAALFPVPESFLAEAVTEIERDAPPARRPAASAMGGFATLAAAPR